MGIPEQNYSYSFQKVNQRTYLIAVQLKYQLYSQSLTVAVDPQRITSKNNLYLAKIRVSVQIPDGPLVNQKYANYIQKTSNELKIFMYIVVFFIVLLLPLRYYPYLIVIQVVQIYYMHLFINAQMGLLFINVSKALAFIDFMWLPSPFQLMIPNGYKTTYQNKYYNNSIKNILFVQNSGRFLLIFLIFLLISLIYLAVRNIEVCTRFTKKYKDRIFLSLIHDAIWIGYMPLLFFGLIQFKEAVFNQVWQVFNLIFALIMIIVVVGYTVYILFISIKYCKNSEGLPQHHNFLGNQPCSILQLPVRLLRKFLLCIFLLIEISEMQIFTFISINVIFLAVLFAFQNSKILNTNKRTIVKNNRWTYKQYTTNKVVLRVLEILYITFEIMIIFRNTGNGHQFWLIVLEIVAIILASIWAIWRFYLAIRPFLIQHFPRIFKQKEQKSIKSQVELKEPKWIAQQQQEYEKDLQINKKHITKISDITQSELESITSEKIGQKYNYYVKNKNKSKPINDTLISQNEIDNQILMYKKKNIKQLDDFEQNNINSSILKKFQFSPIKKSNLREQTFLDSFNKSRQKKQSSDQSKLYAQQKSKQYFKKKELPIFQEVKYKKQNKLEDKNDNNKVNQRNIWLDNDFESQQEEKKQKIIKKAQKKTGNLFLKEESPSQQDYELIHL